MAELCSLVRIWSEKVMSTFTLFLHSVGTEIGDVIYTAVKYQGLSVYK